MQGNPKYYAILKYLIPLPPLLQIDFALLNYSNEKVNICLLVTLKRRLLIVKPIQSARTIKTTKELPLNYLNSLSSPIRHEAEAISNLRISCSILERCLVI